MGEEKKVRVFVFGSNEAGKHTLGTAMTAMKSYGAVYGKGRGLQGRSYAIPVKDIFLRERRVDQVRKDVEVFLDFARRNEEIEFKVSKLGNGLSRIGGEELTFIY